MHCSLRIVLMCLFTAFGGSADVVQTFTPAIEDTRRWVERVLGRKVDARNDSSTSSSTLGSVAATASGSVLNAAVPPWALHPAVAMPVIHTSSHSSSTLEQIQRCIQLGRPVVVCLDDAREQEMQDELYQPLSEVRSYRADFNRKIEQMQRILSTRTHFGPNLSSVEIGRSLVPRWRSVGAWSPCSATCDGFQTRPYSCHNGSLSDCIKIAGPQPGHARRPCGYLCTLPPALSGKVEAAAAARPPPPTTVANADSSAAATATLAATATAPPAARIVAVTAAAGTATAISATAPAIEKAQAITLTNLTVTSLTLTPTTSNISAETGVPEKHRSDTRSGLRSYFTEVAGSTCFESTVTKLDCACVKASRCNVFSSAGTSMMTQTCNQHAAHSLSPQEATLQKCAQYAGRCTHLPTDASMGQMCCCVGESLDLPNATPTIQKRNKRLQRQMGIIPPQNTRTAEVVRSSACAHSRLGCMHTTVKAKHSVHSHNDDLVSNVQSRYPNWTATAAFGVLLALTGCLCVLGGAALGFHWCMKHNRRHGHQDYRKYKDQDEEMEMTTKVV